MTVGVDLRHLARAPLRDAAPYDPGPSVRELEARYGVGGIVKLNWNEDLFGPLPGVREAVIDELDRIALYPEQAYEDLRAAVAGWTGAPAATIVPAHGIQALIMTMVALFLGPGATAVVASPTYGLYATACASAGAEVVAVACRSLRSDLPAMAAAARRTGARVVWVCDPNNPTGAAVGGDEWDAFLDALPEDCVAVVDEAYADYRAPAERIAREADVAAGRPVVVLRTFSKLFGLAGLRLGYALVPESLHPCLDAVQEPFNVNRAALAAGLACLRQPEAVERRRREVADARERLAAGLRALGMKPAPSQANFVLVDTGVEDRALVDVLARRGLLLRAGSEFGLAGHVRITVGPPPLMDRVLAELAAVRDGHSRANATSR